MEAAGGVRRGPPGSPPRRRAPQRAREMRPPHVSAGEPREGLQLRGDGGYCSGYMVEQEDVQRKISKLKLKPECTETQHGPQWP